MGIHINNEYFEHFVFSDDPIKNAIMGMAYIRECELTTEYEWLVDSCCPDAFGGPVEKANDCYNRMLEIRKELESLLDDTGITQEEYETAKNNLR